MSNTINPNDPIPGEVPRDQAPAVSPGAAAPSGAVTFQQRLLGIVATMNLEGVDPSTLESFRAAANQVVNELPPISTAQELIDHLKGKLKEYSDASTELKAQFDNLVAEGEEGPQSPRRYAALNNDQEDLFKGTIVTGLVAISSMAEIMMRAIESIQTSQILTQKLQEKMTEFGLSLSNAFSDALQKQTAKIQQIEKDKPKDMAQQIQDATLQFNKINADSQAASAYISGMTTSTSNAMAGIVQAIEVSQQNVASGVQKLFDTISQLL